MSIEKQTDTWVAAGLLDAHQAAAIRAYENSLPRRNWVVLGISGVGAMAFATGAVALVASHWNGIPVWLKLCCYFLLQSCSGFLFIKINSSMGAAKRVWRESALILFNLLYFAGIGLVAQIYNLHSESWHGLLFWCGLGLPATLLAESIWPGLIWCTVLTATAAYWAKDAYNVTDESPYILVVLGFALTALGFANRCLPGLALAWRRACANFGLLIIAFATAPFSFGYYEAMTHRTSSSTWLTALLALGLIAAATPFLLAKPPNAKTGQALGACLIAALVFFVLPLICAMQHQKILGCALFFVCWGLAANAAAQAGRRHLFNLVGLVLAVRIIVIYFEVMGSLAHTGLGLMASGVVITLVAYGWNRVRVKGDGA